ncbi:MAG: multifunctional CCA addition/repair protein [Halioglobus sp.]|nr:multifunctional CCA addition/repair protein [Halioglobus sp.]
METYLVGGAVRDALLQLTPRERDWVVVGATPAQLLQQGYEQVGRDFPVFLHPETREEYALARTERKQGHGYTGFAVHCDPAVTLEEDLLRRDLTINAMAQDAQGAIIDPHGGQRDLQRRLLRHVSAAFVEDPLRVLRTARFAARFAHLGFRVAEETLALMRDIVAAGELQHLPHERVWTELERALGERTPTEFVRVLHACGALQVLLPEVEALFGVPQPPQHHPEVDTGEHVLLALEVATRMQACTEVRFAVLLHDLGKGITPAEELPRHIGHEERGVPLVRAVCERLRAPNRYRELALVVCRHHLVCHWARELRGSTLLQLLTDTDALRRPERFEWFLQCCEADARGRLGRQEQHYDSGDYLREALAVARAVDAGDFADSGLSGPQLGKAIERERIRRLQALRDSA